MASHMLPGPSPEGRGDLREIAAELQLAAARPVEAVEGSLHQGRHDTAEACLVCTVIPLTIMLHAKPKGLGRTRKSPESCPGSPPPGRHTSRLAMGDAALTRL